MGEKTEVGGEKVRVDMPADAEVNVFERDPHNINQHLKLTFQDVFAEPDPSIFSFDGIWRLAFKVVTFDRCVQVFTLTKLWWYRILTAVFGLPIALCWGLQFACLSFCNIWIWVPYLQAWFIYMSCFRKMFDYVITALVIPIYEAIGRIFSFITVTVRKE